MWLMENWLSALFPYTLLLSPVFWVAIVRNKDTTECGSFIRSRSLRLWTTLPT